MISAKDRQPLQVEPESRGEDDEHGGQADKPEKHQRPPPHAGPPGRWPRR